MRIDSKAPNRVVKVDRNWAMASFATKPDKNKEQMQLSQKSIAEVGYWKASILTCKELKYKNGKSTNTKSISILQIQKDKYLSHFFNNFHIFPSSLS